MPNKDSAQITKPKFCIGQIIAGSYFAGTVQAAFFADGEWNYNIGENADIQPTTSEDKTLGHRYGPKYIRESDVKWKQLLMEWEAV